jgi:hypothetical protein
MFRWLDQPGWRSLLSACFVFLSLAVLAHPEPPALDAATSAAWWIILMVTVVAWSRWGARRQRASLWAAQRRDVGGSDVAKQAVLGVALSIPMVGVVCVVGIVVAVVVAALVSPRGAMTVPWLPEVLGPPIAWLLLFSATSCVVLFVVAAVVRPWRHRH